MNPVLPWTRECTACHRPIRADSPYYERAKGPVCGGRIKRSRKPAGAADEGQHRAVAVHPDQLELFEEEQS